jgi:hypothetical protein
MGSTKYNKISRQIKISKMEISNSRRTRKALDEFLQRSLIVLIGSTSRQRGRANQRPVVWRTSSIP